MSEQTLEQPVSMLPQIDIAAKYTYVLSRKNEVRGRVFDEKGNPRPDPEFPPRKNILLRSSIIWPANPDKEREGMVDPWSSKVRKPGRHLIRYYDGCTTLFVDDQPREKETIDQMVASTREAFFINGYYSVYGYDDMLKTYLDWASWNEESPLRVESVEPMFKMLDAEKEREEEGEELDELELAMERAKTAKEDHMRVHCNFLNVPTVDYKTGVELSTKALRTEYRKAAKADPAGFNRTYNDESMHVKHWIEKAMKNGEISTTKVPNRAAWGKKGSVICDISGMTNPEVILNHLIQFAQTDEGKDFKQQLKALNK